MHTPSGRFQPSTRLCLSISDFHPKSFNPAWEVSTILIGLMSFMTGDEMTTGSVRATEQERRYVARQTRWWNATGGGTAGPDGRRPGVVASTKGIGAVKAGDGGIKFKAEWPELYEENWRWIREQGLDPTTGHKPLETAGSSCSPETAALRRRAGGSQTALGAVGGGGQVAQGAGQSWIKRYKWVLGGFVLFGYILVARLLGGATGEATNSEYGYNTF